MFLEMKKFTAAAVQSSPVFLDATATTEKVCDLIGQAATRGANLVAFPEVFIPGYPYWNWILTPVQGSKWYEKLYLNSVDVPGPLVDRICAAAKTNNIIVVIGINERGSKSLGTIYNTILIIDENGELIGHHRKLVPTWAEKLTWTGGDGSTLNVYDTSIGPLGVLACGENTNTLARFSLLAQGELVHISNYIGLPTAPKSYNMAKSIEIRSSAHAFEGKLFNITSCSTVSEEIISEMQKDCSEARELLTREQYSWTGIIGPDGFPIGEPLIDKEGIVFADIDLTKCIQPKQMHDIIGHYNRFDIFDLQVNKKHQTPTTFLNSNNSSNSIVAKQDDTDCEQNGGDLTEG